MAEPLKEIVDFSNLIVVPEQGIKVPDEKITIPDEMASEIKNLLISKECLARRLEVVADQIAADFRPEVFAVVILRGAVIFFSDLVRALSERGVYVIYDVSVVSSYVESESTGEIKIHLDVEQNIQDRDVLIVEDIVDTGLTLNRLKKYYTYERKARSVRICAFMDKPARRKEDVNADYVGFEVPNYFLVGYGLDFNQQYRSLPFVAILDPKIYEK